MKFQFVVLILAVALAAGASFHLYHTAQAASTLGGKAQAGPWGAEASADPGLDDLKNHDVGDLYQGSATVSVCVAGDTKSESHDIWVGVFAKNNGDKYIKDQNAEVSKWGWPTQGKDASSTATLQGTNGYDGEDAYKGGCDGDGDGGGNGTSS